MFLPYILMRFDVLLYYALLITYLHTTILRCNLLLADSQQDKLTEVISECHDISIKTNNNITIKQSICDVTNKVQVQDAIRKADELVTNHPASILVNSAGITRDGLTSNLSNEDWDSVIDVNLKGTFLMCQAFCKPNRLNSLLLDSRIGGSIINIGSIVSNYGNVGQVNYAASKGGVLGLTRSLAKEMASLSVKATSCSLDSSITRDSDGKNSIPPTVRVNCIQPGFISTPMAQAVPEHILSKMTQKIAMKRLGQASDVANLACFLASSERSGYITGEAFECSGMLRL